MDNSFIPPTTTPEDMALCRRWTAHFIETSLNLPFSFRYGDELVRGIPATWNPVFHQRTIDANLVETVFEGLEPRTGLQVRFEWLAYRDFPVVEWTAWLSNRGERPTAIISDLLGLEATFQGDTPRLQHCNGDFYSADGYTQQETALLPGDSLRFAPNGGRPSDGAFPYYRLTFDGFGLTLAIGWPAQWAAHFEGLAHAVRLGVGQEKTHLRLLPGETIRTPRITLLAWQGDSRRAVNLWRRWYLAHVLPRPDGLPLQPRLAVCGPEEGEEFTAATHENQLANIQKFEALGFDFDVWWIDAGWYPCYNEQGERRWWNTGTWQPDPERFPQGLQAVSERADQAGADLLVWFEPERVRPNTQLDREHPQWLLRSSKDDNRLLNLGNPQARQWLTDHACRLIQENGIRIYRQDFNFPPLNHWRENEAEDRQGINENLHVQGYLQYWDDLLRRNPGLWIDSCSSGGRRNDLETMRRAVPLHYTDYGYGEHAIKLAFHRTLYAWIPYFKDATLSWDQRGPVRFDPQVDSFSFHCGMAPMLFASLDIRRQDYDFPLALKMIAIWRQAAPILLNGDYYPLAPQDGLSGQAQPERSPSVWVAWQFDQPESGGGLLQAFRLPECPQEALSVTPRGLDPNADYRLENPESGECMACSGATLLEQGFTFHLPQRAAAMWFYRKIID